MPVRNFYLAEYGLGNDNAISLGMADYGKRGALRSDLNARHYQALDGSCPLLHA